MAKVAFRATRSRQKFSNAPAVRAELTKTLNRKSKPELIDLHEEVVADWETQIGFAGRNFVKPNSVSVSVFPTGPNKKIWFYVDRGTRPHEIRAKNAPFLVFVWGGPGSYVPKTTPVGEFGGPGVVTGGEIHRTVSVNHPGNEPRDFSKTIRKNYQPTFSRDMENAFRRGIRKVN